MRLWLGALRRRCPPTGRTSATIWPGVANCADVAIVTAALAKRNLTTVGPKLSMPDSEIAAMLGDVRRLAAFGAALRSAASRAADQRFELTRLDELFPGSDALATSVRADVLSRIGRDDV